ncbi:hypothetical protein [Limobrevibacterium gyesilva]|uniref:Uncharacterized protein n=1 Tax=Limobrevibacterium gyesilva TaxID=2991712 RepID=A0AA41YKW1_9PROT|nr:hypothetical protein [Limobrevibacterium gyesilva]MCW3475656.1 hypothetical protein [Limobrevibacterium gyesilva]
MLIARWQIDARFGHKQKVIDMLRDWTSTIAPQAGLTRGQILTGSIGALEATVEHNWQVDDLAELERAWAKLGTIAAHAQWGKDLEPFVVSGTAKWNVYRML